MLVPTLGSVFAGHRLDAVAGQGGMGIVYRATDLRLQRTVALKLIAPELSRDDGFRLRFQRESQTAASIRHPHVITIFHAGEEDGLLFVTMDYINGTDLAATLKSYGRLPAADAVGAVAQIASALDAAHARGLVHRDVKPANVLVETVDGRSHTVLTDFGLTKLAASQTKVTATGMFVGTIDYIAPEQLEGHRVDARADVYALGCVLYHLLTGSVPFPRETQLATLYAHANEPPPSIREIDPSLPRELDEVVRRAMEKRPEARFPSAGDLGRAAGEAIGWGRGAAREGSVARGEAAAGSPPTAPAVLGGRGAAPPALEAQPPPAPPRPPEPAAPPPPPGPEGEPSPDRLRTRRRRIVAAIAAAVAAAGVVGALVLMLGGGGSEPDRAAVSGAPKLNRTIPAGSVANVGDAHVTKAAFRHWDAVSARKSGASTARTQTMQFLISAEWLTQESAKRGIATTPREVRATFDKQKRKSFSSEAAYQRFVRTSGQTEADLLYRVKLSLLTNKLQSDVTKGAPPVTDQQVSDYYDKNRQRFARPETRDLLVILNPRRAEADAAARALESGATWSTVARRYSTDGASRSQGGRLPGVTKGQQERTFDDAIFTAPAGSVEGPVKTQFGYYVFKVTRIHPASQQSLPQVRNAIRQQLTSQREQKGLNDFVNDFQKRYRAATWCATGYVVDQCANGGELRPSTSMPAPSGP